jgi:hypothetical protein
MMDPVDPKYRDMLNRLAAGIDTAFNGELRPKQVGFCVLLFNFDKIEAGRMNWISNGERKDMIVALKEMVAQLEGRTSSSGRA